MTHDTTQQGGASNAASDRFGSGSAEGGIRPTLARQVGTGDAKLAVQQLEIIRSPDQIPPHRSVLTEPGAPLQVTERDREALVLLDVGEGEGTKRAALLWVNRAAQRDQMIDIEQRARSAGWKISARYEADQSILQFLYTPEIARHQHVVTADERTRMDDEIDRLIGTALMLEASDIHLRVLGDRGEIFFRIHGDLMRHQVIRRDSADLLSNALYTAADADSKQSTFNPKAYQDAAVTRTVRRPDGIESALKLRFASLPVYPSGWDIVLRLLPLGAGGSVRSLDQLGYDRAQRAAITRMLSRPTGAIVMAGTTGSGKSTTLQTMVSMYYNHHEGKKLPRSIEDPVEYPIVGARQTPVVRSEGKENPFAKALKAAMRADPDALLVGEVRDETTARLWMQAVQTGHKCFTTVHAGNPFDAIERLVDLGVKRTVIAADEFISGIIYQRLLPVLCSHCKVPWAQGAASLSEGLLERATLVIGDRADSVFLRGPGCTECRHQGVGGRTIAAQILLMDREMQHFLLQEQLVLAKAYWRAGISPAPHDIAPVMGRTALDQGIAKMLEGRVSPVDVEMELGYLDDQPDPHSERQFYETRHTHRVNR